MTNFIDDFKGYILSDVPECSPEWAEACGVAALSTAVGPKKSTFTRIGSLHLNVWHYYIAPSGTVKTVPLQYFVEPTLEFANDIINNSDKDKVEDSEEEGAPKTDLLLPHTFSVEAILAYMRSKKHRSGLIDLDEAGGYFKAAKTKSYMADWYDTYSKMYDGQTLRPTFIKMGAYRPIRDPYVTVLMAATPAVYLDIPPEYAIQGTANRILHLIGDEPKAPVKPESPEDYFTNEPEDAKQEREDRLAGFAQRLVNIRNSEVEIVDLYPVGELLLKNKTEVDKAMFETSDAYLKGYLHRANEMTLKLTALHLLGEWGNGGNPGKILVTTTRDAEWAISKVWRHIEHYKRFLKEWGMGLYRSGALPAEPKSYAGQLEEVREFLRKKGGTVVQSEVKREFRWDARTWAEVLKLGQETGTLALETGESTGGRRPLYWRQVED